MTSSGANLAIVPWLARVLGLGLALSLSLVACDSSGANLAIDLETDFIAGREFAGVRVEVTEGAFPSDEPVPGAIEMLAGTASYVPGRRIGEFRALPLGDHLVRVRLIDVAGATVVSRVVSVRLRATYALTIVVTRDCAGITCPEPEGDPGFTTCLRGECAAPECGIDGAAPCPTPQCALDADCPPSSECVRPVCSEGACLQLGDDAGCDPEQRCDVTLGCVPRDGAVPDAGPDDAATVDAAAAPDAALPDAGPPDACPTAEVACTNGMDDDCDALADCADPDCLDTPCDDGMDCTMADACDVRGVCAGAPLDCDDAVGCTVDSCAEGAGCSHAPTDSLCAAMPLGTCDVALDCQYPTCTTVSCSAVDACETAACEGSTCVHTPVCTAAQTCCGGACRSMACDDGNPCTTDAFSATTCACTHTNNTAACNDGSACTSSDRCAAGRCAGTTISCNDGNACTTDTCSRTSGCAHAAVATGTSCGGSSVCCSGTCTSLATSAHCGSCGSSCASGHSCVTVPGRSGVYTCTCGANSQCTGGGFGGMATCYSGYCDCQCAAASPTTCSGQCSGATCHELSGHNYCQY